MTSDKAQSVSQSVYPGPTTEQGTAIHECSQQAERIHYSPIPNTTATIDLQPHGLNKKIWITIRKSIDDIDATSDPLSGMSNDGPNKG
jgi:hypothetical protein